MRKLLAVTGLLLWLAPSAHAQIMGLPPSSAAPGSRIVGSCAASRQWYSRVRPMLQAQNSSFVGAAFGSFTASVTPTSRALTAGWLKGIDQLICGDVNSGRWFNLDHEFVFAAPSQALAFIDLVSSTGPATASAHGAGIAFDAFGGYTLGIAGAAGNAYVDTGFNLATAIAGGSHYQMGAAGMEFCLLGNPFFNGSLNPFTTLNTLGLSVSTGPFIYATIGNSATQSLTNFNTGTAGGGASTTSITGGTFAAGRTSLSAGVTQYFYVNGTSVPPTSTNAVSGTIFSGDLYLLTANGTGGPGVPAKFNTFAEWDIGGIQTAAQITTKRGLMQTLMNNIQQLDGC